jgi:cytidylate kinase
VAREQGISEAKAAHDIHQTDADRAAFVKGYFHEELTDEHHYDLTINTSRIAVEEAAGIVIDALRRRQAANRAASNREQPEAAGSAAR